MKYLYFKYVEVCGKGFSQFYRVIKEIFQTQAEFPSVSNERHNSKSAEEAIFHLMLKVYQDRTKNQWTLQAESYSMTLVSSKT